MVTGGHPSPAFSDEEVHARRCLAVQWLEWSCRNGQILKSDPRYTTVTEDRDRQALQQRVYSSCADLAHWLWYRLGVRSPWLNRREHRGFALGVNVNRLYPPPIGPNPCASRGAGSVEGGDVLVIGTANDTALHVVCVIDRQPGVLCTAEYGATGLHVGGVGGHLVTRPWLDVYHVGSKLIRVWLPLERVLHDAFARGLLVEPDYSVAEDEVPTAVAVPRPRP